MSTIRSLSLVLALGLAVPAAAQTVHQVPGDHDTIQAAVDAAADGDTIEVKGGTYPEAVVITGRSGLTLRAKGKVVLAPPSGTGLVLDQSTGCVVEKLRVAGGSPHGILLQDSVDCQLLACRVDASAGDGIRTDGGSGHLVEGCVVKLAGGDGIALSAGGPGTTDGCTLRENRVIDASLDGLGLNGSDLVAEDNLVTRAGASGIWLDETMVGTGIVLSGNRIVQSGGLGVGVNGDLAQVTGNKVVKSGGRAVQVFTGSGHLVEGNKLVKAGNDGVRIETEAAAVTVRGNTIAAAGDDGIEVDGPGALVEDNKVRGAAEDGIEIDGETGSYTGNTCTGCKETGVQLSEGVDNLVDGNVAKGNKLNGFQLDLDTSGNTLTNNVAKGNKPFDLLDESEGANTLGAGNVFKTIGP